MQPNNLPTYAQTPKTAVVQLSTATPADGSSATLLLTAGPKGAMVSKITGVPTETTTGTTLALYLKPAGSAIKALKERIAVAAYVYATTTKPPLAAFTATEEIPILLGAGDELYIGVLNDSAIDVSCEYSNF